MTRPHPLTTERLTLLPLAVEHAAALFAIYSHPDAMRYWDTPCHASIEATRAMIERMTHERACWWAIRQRADGRVIGAVGYLGNEGPPGMGYILHPDCWRQGIMREAAHAALGYGFDTLGLDRVELWINDDNAPSQRLAETLGFTRRGRFRQKYHHHKTSHEKLVYGLYRHEWAAGSPAGKKRSPLVYSAQPILAVTDVSATAAYYRDILGFTIAFLYGDPPTFGAVSLHEWTGEGAYIQLAQVDTLAPPQVGLYLFAGPAIDELYARYRATGVQIERALAQQPWGMREFAIRDCNGYLLRFGLPA